MLGDIMDYVLIDKICMDIINYNNINNYSLVNFFYIIMNKYDIDNINKDKVMLKVISTISKYGYDIVSTHPLILKKYK